jgi:quercetin dioxygenase-like cupin family protein
MRPAQDEQKIVDAMGIGRNAPGILVENERVRVLRAHIPAGDKAPMHSHPDHVVYVLKGGKAQLTYPSGKVDVMDLETGEALFMDAQSHEIVNLGDSDLDMVVFELK